MYDNEEKEVYEKLDQIKDMVLVENSKIVGVIYKAPGENKEPVPMIQIFEITMSDEYQPIKMGRAFEMVDN